MDEAMLKELPELNHGISLSRPTIDPFQTEENIESALISLIKDYRGKQKLVYNYDSTLGSLLATALANYEVERVTGSTFCEEEFQKAIKDYIPPKHTFKAFPIHLTTLEPEEILGQLLDQPKAKEILNSKGESLFFGIRSKLVVFPDNILALWLSLAVRYYKLD